VAKTLNAEHIPPPRGHTRGWAPTAIREILRRELYRGVVIWNRTQKVMRAGTKAQRKRPPTEWCRREVPALRIVDEPLWTAVEARRHRAATTFVRTTRTGRLVSRPSGADLESPYLLSGLAQCAVCGGSLVAITRSHGRQRAKFYGCLYHHKRGATVCANAVELRQDILDEAVIEGLSAALSARAIEVTIEKALAKLRTNRARDLDRRAALDRERAAIEARIAHLGDAIKRGKATDTLLDMLATEEDHRKALVREFAGLADLERVAALDAAEVAQEVQGIAEETITLLHGYPAQVRQMIRKLLGGERLRCEPFEEDDRKGYRFQATGTYGRLFTGTVAHDLGSPSGTPPTLTASGAGTPSRRYVPVAVNV
jgi:site-specific DNA recombinase